MPLEDRLVYVQKGIDAPRADQQNTIVRILKNNPISTSLQRNRDDVVVVGTSLEPFSVYMIDDIQSSAKGKLAYAIEEFDAPNSDNFDIIITSGVKGWGNFGFHPILAKYAGSAPGIGELIGPKHGETSLQQNYPGFRFLGASNLTGVGWVIRDRGIATGEGEVITSSGQAGTPANFELESVKFSSGFDGWDHSSDLIVVNKFSDTADAGILVQFKWDAYSEEYVSTDVECA